MEKLITLYTITMINKKKKFLPKLRSKIVFEKKIAIQFSKMAYYRVLTDDIKSLPGRDREKAKYSTPKQTRITDMFALYKQRLHEKSKGYFHVMRGIYNSNVRSANESQTPPVHTNIMSLVASVPALIVAYRKIRNNKGAMTLGAMLAHNELKKMDPFQRKYLSRTTRAPDGLSLSVFTAASYLLKKGKYPWGASRRIYIPKPGRPDELRPITIPPFMDRVVQASILCTLEAIYEPWFTITNKSFGFRPRSGVHDAIYSLIKRENKGMRTAIEGDIKGAFPSMNHKIFIQILSKRVKDRKFLTLMENRLSYFYLDPNTDTHILERVGTPQGGIDSPYLWNIYMHEFDLHVETYVKNLLNSQNKHMRRGTKDNNVIVLKEFANLTTRRRSLLKDLKLLDQVRTKMDYDHLVKEKAPGYMSIRTRLKKYFAEGNSLITPDQRYQIIKQIRRFSHDLPQIPPSDPNRSRLRFCYARYADDWILIGNFPLLLAEKIKKDLQTWLRNELRLELSEDKTAITDFRKPDTPARFLGFEIRTFKTRKLAYKITGNSDRPKLTRVAGTEVSALPDQQRLISRLHMKGYCSPTGKPKPLTWLSTLETFAIISRYNSVLLGMGNFFYGFVPKSSLNRWIYIIRFSLLKTLAQKYDTNIRGIFKKFGIRSQTGNTIQYNVYNTFGESRRLKKSFKLLTELDIQSRCLPNDMYKKILTRYNTIQYDKQIPFYPSKSSRTRDTSIKDDDWVNNIMWVNLRTSASFDLPCCMCGSNRFIQMHHIKHIRKTPYSKISDNNPWLKIMALRNRKQIPVCRNCHMKVIHKGTYNGSNLKSFVSQGVHTPKGYDNRLINIENYINKSNTEYFAKTLEEKGWEEDYTSNDYTD